MDNEIISAVIFMGILGLVSLAFFGSQYSLVSTYNQSSFSNFSSPNVTLVGGASGSGFPPFPICRFTGDIFQDVPAGAVCVANGLGWFLGFLTASSDVPYLQVIFVGIGALILLLVVRMIKPFGSA